MPRKPRVALAFFTGGVASELAVGGGVFIGAMEFTSPTNDVGFTSDAGDAREESGDVVIEEDERGVDMQLNNVDVEGGRVGVKKASLSMLILTGDIVGGRSNAVTRTHKDVIFLSKLTKRPSTRAKASVSCGNDVVEDDEDDCDEHAIDRVEWRDTFWSARESAKLNSDSSISSSSSSVSESSSSSSSSSLKVIVIFRLAEA